MPFCLRLGLFCCYFLFVFCFCFFVIALLFGCKTVRPVRKSLNGAHCVPCYRHYPCLPRSTTSMRRHLRATPSQPSCTETPGRAEWLRWESMTLNDGICLDNDDMIKRVLLRTTLIIFDTFCDTF